MTTPAESGGPGPLPTPGGDARPGGDAVDGPLAGVAAQADAIAALEAALRRPVHAYLLLGPPGSGTRAAARAFAAELLAGDAVGEDAERHRRLALAEAHPDLEVIEREGASISRDQARGIVERAVRSPVEAVRKVLVLTEFHLVLDAAPILLKTLEEPPASTVFVILAEEVPPELVTIASRCAVVRFPPLSPAAVVRHLVAGGVAPGDAARVAEVAGGDLERARLLALDPGLEARMAAWRSIPDRLDGTGAAAARLVDEVVAHLEEAAAPVDARHRAELEALAEREARYGASAGARRQLEARHRRERRRLRQDELRSGLGVLARVERDRLVGALGGPDAPDPLVLDRFRALSEAVEALERNPNEALLLQALLCRLRPLGELTSDAGGAPPARRRRPAR